MFPRYSKTMKPFSHPTAGQLSLIANRHYRWDGGQVGEQLGSFAEEIQPSELKAGDYIETDCWRMVTHYNKEGFGEVLIVEREGDQWHHTFVLYDEGAKATYLSRELVEASMDANSRICTAMLPSLPTAVARSRCTGLNGCCASEN